MIGEDAEKFNEMCREQGEFPPKKFGEITGLTQKLDDNTMVYVTDNGMGVEGKDGR